MNEHKHFNLGTIYGRVVMDSLEEKTSRNSEYLNFQVNVAGRRCGSARAFCRMWKRERFEPLVEHLKRKPDDVLFFKAFYENFVEDRTNNRFSTYTVYSWEVREGDPRAAFILKGEVSVITGVKCGQRMLLHVDRSGNQRNDRDRIEVYLQDEKFLDSPKPGDLIEVKGFLRQEQPEDEFGGSSGSVMGFAEQLKILVASHG